MKTDGLTYRLAGPVSPQQLAELLSPVGTIESGPEERRTLLWFDTFDWRLAENGLCLSTHGSKQTELIDATSGQTLATAPARLGSGFGTDLPGDDIRNRLDPVIEMRRLLPRLRVRLTTTPFSIRDDEGKAVLRGRIERWACRPPKGHAKPHKLARLALEPMRGYHRALRRATAALEPACGSPLTTGQFLADALDAIGDPPEPGGGKLVLGLTPEMTAGEAARAIHLVLLDAMERNEEGTAANIDSEFLHDFRVAVRRTRSALGQIDKDVLPADTVARAKADFRWLGQQTNRMRDLDVYLLDFPGFEAALPDQYQADLTPFHDHLQTQNKRESRQVARMLRSKRYRHLRDDWRAFLIGAPASAEDGPLAGIPVSELGCRRIWKMYRRLVSEGRAITDESPPAALHELRITGKKLRYLLEFFRELFPADKVATLVKALKGLQDVLGRYQDSDVQSAKIVDFAREMVSAGSVPVETQMAMGMVAESIIIRGTEARRQFHDQFELFAGADVEAIFRELFRDGRNQAETGGDE